MSSPRVEERARTVLVEVFDLAPGDVGAATSFDTVERWDSLQHINLVLALEDEFGTRFSEEEVAALLSFPLITMILEEHVAAGRIS